MTARLRYGFIGALFAGAAACSVHGASRGAPESGSGTPVRANEDAEALALPPPPGPSTSEASAVTPELPPGVEVGVPALVPVPEDKPVLVLHAPAHIRRAIVYLHGKCGDVHAVESWKDTATRHGTLIALIGDLPCGAGRFKWPGRVERIQERIERALTAVRAVRGGLLEPAEPILFGYSQGAARASLLAHQYPERYRHVVLGGPPNAPKLENLREARAVAVFGGEREVTTTMKRGTEALVAADKRARFFLLPSAAHGEYGPDGARVMDELLSWLLNAADPS